MNYVGTSENPLPPLGGKNTSTGAALLRVCTVGVVSGLVHGGRADDSQARGETPFLDESAQTAVAPLCGGGG